MKFTVNLILLVAAFPALAGENETNFQVDVRMVQLRATVTDSLGRHVRNLTKDDFEVFENGVRQNIRMVVTPEQKEAAPTTVYVLFTIPKSAPPYRRIDLRIASDPDHAFRVRARAGYHPVISPAIPIKP